MHLNQELNTAKFQINKYDASEGVWVNQTCYKSSLLLSNDIIISPWLEQDQSQLTNKNIDQILQYKPEVLIIGTKNSNSAIDTKLLVKLLENNIGTEIMQPQAACHTFTVLSAEMRKVMVGFI